MIDLSEIFTNQMEFNSDIANRCAEDAKAFLKQARETNNAYAANEATKAIELAGEALAEFQDAIALGVNSSDARQHADNGRKHVWDCIECLNRAMYSLSDKDGQS